jgi:hypothetical protein
MSVMFMPRPPRYDKRQVSYPALRVSKMFVISK